MMMMMMMAFLRKKLPNLSPLPSTLELRKFSTLAPKSTNFITEYLITYCGFSPQNAARVSKHISHVTSPSKPDSVRHFLKHHGFTDPQIRTLIANYPPILCANTATGMGPNLRTLLEMGFAEDDLRKLVTCNPQVLQLASAIPRIEFWRNFLDGNMKKLTQALTRNWGLITGHKKVAPKIALLKEYGLSETGIKSFIVRTNHFSSMSTASLEASLKRVEEFGFARGSPMFALGLLSFHGIKSDTLKAKMDFYKTFGWSDEELISVIQKFPSIFHLSEENVRLTMEFLLQKVGCTPSYIALCPVMIGFSLEKRLIPRHHVMQILKSNGLIGSKPGFSSVVVLTEKKFLKRIIMPYEDKFPTLHETYIAACNGKILL